MYIALYISSHGFGHMTRCLGIMENILKTSDYNIYIVCGKIQNDFARIYLAKYKDRIIYKDLVTDIGLINKENSLEVDKHSLQQELIKFTSSWEDVVNNEYNFLKNLKTKCIVSDISPIGTLVGHKLQLPVVLITNFTWVEQYEYIGIDESIIDKYRQAYSYVTKFIKYDLCLPIRSVNCEEVYEVGFTCRKIDFDRVEKIKQQYGKSIMVTCGKSANLNTINMKNFNGTIFTTPGIDIDCGDDCNVVNLPIDVLDTQNYMAASNMVITKAGWGTIGEAVLGHTNLVLIERPSAKEDSFNIEKIKENKLGISIAEKDLSTIDIQRLESELKNNIDYEKLNNYKNDVSKIVELILA
ncbi:MAG: glycosyltransferase [Romboutsia timonensis]|uniref:glycosyltransferase n=1 Tax=Romboutsia timonensis TaxID=1776391 RepID=UPI002A7542DD|nr:glycosyltransferase [Romboutsia timonensis]MDY2882889.1 glycosyltransferase [Romboutsia timonensis]